VDYVLLSIAKNLLDKIGIAATSLCAIHCLLLPFILPILPMVGASFIAGEVFEDVVLVCTMMLGFVALYSGYKRYHGQIYPFVLLFGGGFIYWQKDMLGVEVEPYLVLMGASLVVAAHVLNMKLCRRCSDC
jgi:hypothetical protein